MLQSDNSLGNNENINQSPGGEIQQDLASPARRPYQSPELTELVVPDATAGGTTTTDCVICNLS